MLEDQGVGGPSERPDGEDGHEDSAGYARPKAHRREGSFYQQKNEDSPNARRPELGPFDRLFATTKGKRREETTWQGKAERKQDGEWSRELLEVLRGQKDLVEQSPEKSCHKSEGEDGP